MSDENEVFPPLSISPMCIYRCTYRVFLIHKAMIMMQFVEGVCLCGNSASIGERYLELASLKRSIDLNTIQMFHGNLGIAEMREVPDIERLALLKRSLLKETRSIGVRHRGHTIHAVVCCLGRL